MRGRVIDGCAELLTVSPSLTVYLGIILFTFHKYRKSIESTVPLDTHGNPVSPDDLDDPLEGSQRHTIELEETMRLTAAVGDDSDEVNLDLSEKIPLFPLTPCTCSG